MMSDGHPEDIYAQLAKLEQDIQSTKNIVDGNQSVLQILDDSVQLFRGQCQNLAVGVQSSIQSQGNLNANFEEGMRVLNTWANQHVEAMEEVNRALWCLEFAESEKQFFIEKQQELEQCLKILYERLAELCAHLGN